MNYRKENDGSYLLRLEIGDEIIESLKIFALSEGLCGAIFEGIGAVDRASVGYFDLEKHDYSRAEIIGQREVLSLKGNIAVDSEGEPIVHAHIILGDAKMNCAGGHLFSGRISVTGEIFVRPCEKILRSHNDATGLKLWKLY